MCLRRLEALCKWPWIFLRAEALENKRARSRFTTMPIMITMPVAMKKDDDGRGNDQSRSEKASPIRTKPS